MALTIGSLGVLIGSPIAGAILSGQSRRNHADGTEDWGEEYTGTLVFTGVALLVCGGFINGTRVIKKGVKLGKV
jgi:hypothetical protein